MSERWDAVVIGAGPAGEVCAGALADGGMRTAVVERELVGGECSYWACIPSKTLVRPGETVEEAQRAPGGREAVTGDVEPGEAFAWRDFMVSGYDDSHATEWLTDKGIEVVRGVGRLDGPGRVAVDDRVLETDRVVLATGTDPVIPPVEGLADVDPWTNREATGAKEVPARLVVMGGGPVGVELAQAFRRFGSGVQLVEGNERLLQRECPGASEALRTGLELDGIEVRTGLRAKRASRDGEDVVLELDDGTHMRGDRVLVATGRKPRVDGLGLDSVGIEPGKSGVEVDQHLRVADGIWAIGDVSGIALFTHVGKYQARVAAADMLGREARADYRAIPHVTFTDPEVAAVGLNPDQARERGIEVETGSAELKGVARTSTYMRNYDELPGFLTLVLDRRRGVLVGAYAVGPQAGEWLGQATLAVRAEVPVAVLRDVIQPFPTFSEAFVNALADLEVG